jgi:hypothetical protein
VYRIQEFEVKDAWKKDEGGQCDGSGWDLLGFKSEGLRKRGYEMMKANTW